MLFGYEASKKTVTSVIKISDKDNHGGYLHFNSSFMPTTVILEFDGTTYTYTEDKIKYVSGTEYKVYYSVKALGLGMPSVGHEIIIS